MTPDYVSVPFEPVRKVRMTYRHRRLFDQLDIAGIRYRATLWDMIAVVMIGLIIGSVPLILVLLGYGGKRCS